MHKYKTEGVVPRYLLEKLAREGNDKAKKSIEQERVTPKKKKKNEEQPSLATPEEPLATNREHIPARHIYDSQGQVDNDKLVRDEGDPPTNDEDVNRVYDFSKITLDYYKKILNRNSIDDRGMDLKFFVHYDHLFNARWNEEEEVMQFGDGDGKDILNFTAALDVIAHEMSHGVTQYTAQLVYSEQSGALNEHFSDVIGSAVKQHANGQNALNADWLIGDKIIGPEFNGIALRSMKNPGTAFEGDPQPDHMRNYKNMPVTKAGDYGGVHINSGIPNKAFYLVSKEIGTDNAAILWYTAWNDRQHLHAESQFKDAFEGILKAAQTLTNQGKMPQNSVEAVKKAFSEVGIYSPATV